MSAWTDLRADVDAEYTSLRSIMDDLGDDDPRWDLLTPADGWMVRDQISHLAFFDDAGRLAVVDPDAFASAASEFVAATGDPMDAHLIKGRSMGGTELLAWWDHAHDQMIEAFVGVEPSTRIPWFGPSMGAMSFLSARLMETWAHGQDIVDAIGVDRLPTDRLRHIAHLGVRARPFSYLVRDMAVPDGQIVVEVIAPSGEPWRWEVGDEGPDEEIASITGTALDFCLVVTQRRNVNDTGLTLTGRLAEDWISVAQAFAGPPGPGRSHVNEGR